ncbi:PKD domain-containing protein [Aquimarina sp. MMG016]|uniref:PKD domain-containing protein n=1 Tax=Aquimarina sp. MMG016 TaxID=2822690 RepID=UPI001B3A32BE|nr:PKD domain-containing protein [Aquimarina sp. MMG016]MBQ4821966.1 PKD domain-containing protein [Aquimarina sp. MMG016]
MKTLILLKQLLREPCNTLQNGSVKFLMILFIILFANSTAIAQTKNSYSLGNESIFSQKLLSINKSNTITLKLSDTESIAGKVNLKEGDINNYSIIGLIGNNTSSTFNITKQDGILEGHIILFDQKKAYKYYSGDNDDVYIEEVDINKVLCIDFEQVASKEKDIGKVSAKAPDLQSLPGAEATVYLDFDGEVVENTRWAGGSRIDAVPSGYSDDKILAIWRIMAEDFRPFNINITTNRAIYEAAPQNRRMMCIFTSTTTAAPGSGGVAYLNSFSSTRNDDPCWAFNNGTRSAGETGSHEVGHTLGLSHDGLRSGTTYYAGHGDWSPIMGWSVNRPIGHWSKGEYDNADQDQDDLAIISGNRNGFGYKNDDFGDTITEAGELIVDAQGNVNASQNSGLITTRADKDVLSFITAGGEVNFDFQPDPYYPNLNIQARILNGAGEEIAISSPSRDLSASINTTLDGGTYFIEIDGVGEGNLSTGYSDYSSIGFYSISGSYAPGNNNQPPVANFEASKDCSQVAFKSTSINTVNTYLWDFGDGNTSTSQNPNHTYSQSGTYTVKLTVTNDIGSDTNTKDNFVDISVPTLPNGISENACSGESVTLSLSGSNGYIWYDQEQGGNIIATGSTFETPELTEGKTYYVSGTSSPITTAEVGMKEISDASGNIHGGGYYLIFDAEEPLMLKKARVSAQGAGNRTLQLLDTSEQVLATKTINIPDGESIIEINLDIPAGNDLRIGFTDGANLFRSNQNINYPYQVSNIISIKQSTATSNPQGFYYYLYDWQISTLGECETDQRTAVTVNTIDAPEVPAISLDDDKFEISVAGQYSAYQWYLDDVAIENATNSSIIVEEIGVYTLEVFNAAGCSTTSEGLLIEALSVDTPNPIDNVTIYPNPAYETLFVNGLEKVGEEVYSVRVVNMLGQVVTSYNGPIASVNTKSLEVGLYFLVVNNKMTKKFMKSK